MNYKSSKIRLYAGNDATGGKYAILTKWNVRKFQFY